eukprot:m51a1_g243 hypothetical protein (241) ;mRNA; f:146849-147748
MQWAWSAAWLEGLRERYREPWRRHHRERHVQEMVALLAAHPPPPPLAADPAGEADEADAADAGQALLLAAWFHDAVYEPQRSDNEERSADLFRRFCAEAPVPSVAPATAAAVVRLIDATRAHTEGAAAGACPLLDAFLDADLAVLGAPAPRYDEYARDIRAEYSAYSDAQYCAGRAAVLRGFLAAPRLYRTSWGAALFEAQARANIARELAALCAPAPQQPPPCSSSDGSSSNSSSAPLP